MTIHYSGKELLERAIGMEVNGEKFYRMVADRTDDKEVKHMYISLAIEEKKHVDTFRHMLESADFSESSGTGSEENINYLKALFTNPVFSSNDHMLQRLTTLTDQIEALDIGIQAEKDSILIYDEMNKYTQQSGRDVLYAIIREEQSHLWQLSQLKADILEKRTPVWLRRIAKYGDTIADH